MDARKHQLILWVRFFAVCSLALFCSAQAAIESVSPTAIMFADMSKLHFTAEVPTYDAAGCRMGEILLCAGRCNGFDPNLFEPYTLYQGGCYNRTAMIFGSLYGVCPEASPSYGFNSVTRMCQRTVPDTLTIALTGGTEIEPSNGSNKKFLPIIAIVKDQKGQPATSSVKVKISLKVDPISGGHDHGASTRPRGGIAEVETCPSDGECWSNATEGNGNGQVVFNFNAPETSGTHTITATCDGCGNTETKSVNVRVNGLSSIPTSTFYDFIGETGNHSANHYLTPEAASVLWRIAVSYQVEQQFKLQDPATKKFTVAPPRLRVNDASLEWGGLFDISGKWASPHVEHRRGTVIDVRANNLGTAIPTQNFKAFKSLAADFGADAHFESPSIERRHVHLRLLNREE